MKKEGFVTVPTLQRALAILSLAAAVGMECDVQFKGEGGYALTRK